MTTRSIKGNVLRFATKRRNDEKLVHSKSDCLWNTSDFIEEGKRLALAFR